MLTRLARLLRASGHDALLAEPGSSDSALLDAARAQGRALLTRDRRLAGVAAAFGVETLAMQADKAEDQAAELARAYPIDWLMAPLTRCLVDNALLRPAIAAEIDAIPPGARGLAGPFMACPACGRIFWPGSHARRIVRQLTVLAAT